ncbi:MAG: right-handed parallel beta-helix repeat-containing protein [Clostridiales bacterium]|nr:right-handed parallel beta-helix repeat-containing protein [Clostridiales bacterium]
MIYYVALSGSDLNSGSLESPWATIKHAASVLKAGDTLYIREGVYNISEPIMPKNSGTEEEIITYSAYFNEKVVIDAYAINFYKEEEEKYLAASTGAIHIENLKYICIRNLKVINSHGQGIAIRDSSYIQVNNCTTENTFACGISIWDTDSTATHSCYNQITGNTVIKANTWNMIPEGMKRGPEPPHEAISIAGASYFEVSFNHVYNCDKEGIDVKEVSRHGRVHHNYVHDLDRQGLYVDAWFGVLEDVELYENVVTNCHGAGIALSAEGGPMIKNIKIYNNLVYNNHGTGILFGTWGDNALRKNISIYNNILVHNGHGTPEKGMEYFWITGGLCMLSGNLEDVKIYNNIFSDNSGFQIGYSAAFLKEGKNIDAILENKRIFIKSNIINDKNETRYPIYSGWQGNYTYLYNIKGSNYSEKDPELKLNTKSDLVRWIKAAEW